MDLYCYRSIHGIDERNAHLPAKSRQLPLRTLLLSSDLPRRLTKAVLDIHCDISCRRVDGAGMKLVLNYAKGLDDSKLDMAASYCADDYLDKLRPSSGFQSTVALRGHVPDKMLACAALLRLWYAYCTTKCRGAIEKYRRLFPSAFPCSVCLKPHVTLRDLREHHGKCSGAIVMPDWIRSVALQPLRNELIRVVNTLESYPSLKRSYGSVTADQLSCDFNSLMGMADVEHNESKS